MKTIWKQALEFPKTEFEIPGFINVVAMQTQRGAPTVWIECDPSQALKTITLTIFGTGHKIPDEQIYVGTFQMADGDLVWHLYRNPLP